MCTFVGNMKHLVYILLGLMLVGVFSCRRSPGGAEARLVAIDSLITAEPDSALALLAGINADSLPADLRAYHDMLTTQALYKAYIPATTDTLIARAWSYYRDHGPYDRRIRAMLYSGTTAEELGRPDSAMRWYKRTELESRPDDHYHRAYAQEKMGILYQSCFSYRQAIEKYRMALSTMDSTDIAAWAYCTQQLAQLYLSEKPDSARFYIDKISKYVKDSNDSIYLLANLTNKSSMWFYCQQYDSATDVAREAINIFDKKVPYTCWYDLVVSYANIGRIDSAQLYFARMPIASTKRDSIFYYEMLHVLNRNQGKWENALKYEKISNNLTDDVWSNESDNPIIQAEHQALTDYKAAHNSISWWVYFIIGLLIAVPCVAFFNSKRQKRLAEKHAEEQISWLTGQFTEAKSRIKDLQSEKQNLISPVNEVKSELRQSHEENDRLKSVQADADIMKMVNAQFKSAFQNCLQRLGDIAANYYEHGDNSTEFIGQFKKEFESCWSSQDFWMAMESHINSSRNDAIRRIKDAHPEISISELRLLMLIILNFDPMAITICMGYKNINVLYSMKNKLKNKLKTGKKSLEEYLETYM